MNRSAAFFDVDGTIVDRHILHHFVFLRTRLMPGPVRPFWTGLFWCKAPYYAVLDRLSRTEMNRIFYRGYAGLPALRIRAAATDCFREVIRPYVFAGARDCIRGHRESGRQVVLVTGSIDFIMEPLARELGADALIAPKLVERDGRFTGELAGEPVGAEEKARLIREYADRRHLVLGECRAYGDSFADEPMLSAVGHPHVVNPDTKLASIARQRSWPVVRWRRPARAPEVVEP